MTAALSYCCFAIVASRFRTAIGPRYFLRVLLLVLLIQSVIGGSRDPGTSILKLLHNAPNAKCLDGSPAGYYLDRGTSGNFLIWLEGAASLCIDTVHCDYPSSHRKTQEDTCRSKQATCSSNKWAQVKKNQGEPLSCNPAKNPVFHNWTKVSVPACDGSGFFGDRDANGLYFRARSILNAVLEDIRATTEIQNAEFVVLAGESQSSMAVIAHVDTVADKLALVQGEVVGLPFSGFPLDLPNEHGVHCWRAQWRNMFDLSDGYKSLHPRCLARFPNEKWKCVFPQYYGDLISSRLFIINSLYGLYEIVFVLGLHGCWYNISICDHHAQQLIYALRQQHISAWTSLATRPGNGLWATACEYNIPWHWTDPEWKVPAYSGPTQAEAVQKWLLGEGVGIEAEYVHVDDATLANATPCNLKRVVSEIV